MILLIDDIKECSKLPDDIQLQLHRIMTKTKGYGVLVLCGIRQGDLFNFYTQDQLGVDLKSSGVALALSDTAVHYEGFYKNNFTQSQRNAELEKGFGIFFAGNGSKKIKDLMQDISDSLEGLDPLASFDPEQVSLVDQRNGRRLNAENSLSEECVWNGDILEIQGYR